MLFNHSTSVVAIAALTLTSPAWAVPTFGTFGPFDATFGGSGIPNGSVAVSEQFVADYDSASGRQSATITVAMNATQRFSNPAVTNDGIGTFFATPGSNFGDPSNPDGPGPSASRGATWNFNYYIGVEGINGSTPTLEDFNIDLFYDFDPGNDTPVGQRGRIDIDNAVTGTGPTVVQNSQNLMFQFLENGIPTVVVPPTGVTSFDAEATGEYSFAIEVGSLLDSSDITTVGIDVVVIPEPASLVLAGIGAGLILVRRRSATR